MEAEQVNEQKSSVEFQTSTKGYVTYKVKCYHDDPDAALEKAMELSDNARQYANRYNGE